MLNIVQLLILFNISIIWKSKLYKYSNKNKSESYSRSFKGILQIILVYYESNMTLEEKLLSIAVVILFFLNEILTAKQYPVSFVVN